MKQDISNSESGNVGSVEGMVGKKEDSKFTIFWVVAQILLLTLLFSVDLVIRILLTIVKSIASYSLKLFYFLKKFNTYLWKKILGF